MAQLEVSRSDGPGSPVILSMIGEFDLVNVQPLRDCLAAWLINGQHEAILDLTGTEFIDSTVMGVLVTAEVAGLMLTLRARPALCAVRSRSPDSETSSRSRTSLRQSGLPAVAPLEAADPDRSRGEQVGREEGPTERDPSVAGVCGLSLAQRLGGCDQLIAIVGPTGRSGRSRRGDQRSRERVSVDD